MNKIFLTGNLTHDPELTETAAGVAVCRFSIAVNRRASNGDQKADFYNVTAWRGLAETISRYSRKGNKLLVIGNIELGEYEDRDGNKRTSINIVAQDVEFLTPKSEQAEERESTKKKPTLQAFDDDSDIPF